MTKNGLVVMMVGVIAMLLFASNANAGVVLTDLVSWWKFDEGTGTTAYDDPAHGSGNNGTLNNFASPHGWTTDTPGPASSYALNFDGTDDYVYVPDNNSLDVTAITIEVWIKPETAFSDKHRFVTKDPAYIIRGRLTDEVNFSIYTDHSGVAKYDQIMTDTSPISNLNVWYQVVGTYNSTDGSMKIFINGDEVKSGTHLHGGEINCSNNALFVGKYSGSTEYFDGIIDEVRIYKRALSENEIEENYNATIIPEPSALLLLGGGLLGILVFRWKLKD